jgi:predicted esterase
MIRTIARVLVCSVFVLAVCAALSAQISVPFLASPPDIDGVLDDSLHSLAVHQFSVVDSDGPAAQVKPTYRIAYGTKFLYLYIEVDSSDIITRDRAYQNGDGFHLAITHPMSGDAPTKEFYVMGFSTSSRTPQAWQRKFVWYRDVDLAFTRLESAVIESHTENGKTGIELLLPWSEVYPFHPWLTDAIGFNLCYVKASGGRGRTYYYALLDDNFQSEQSPRKYVRLQFEPPTLADGTQAYAILDRNHIVRGEHVLLKTAILAAKPGDVALSARVFSGEDTALESTRKSISVPAGVSVTSVELPVSALPADGYDVAWNVPLENASARRGLTILPSYDAKALGVRLEKVKPRIAHGSFDTLQFQLQQIQAEAQRLKPYDTAASLRFMLSDFMDTVAAAEQGKDVIAARTGMFRRAYRSRMDGTLQPYSVLIPAKLEPGRKYPLVVYLHGSGEDDRDQLREDFVPDTFIQLAPNGRGTSNYYTADHSQDDIAEAISAVIQNYPVDPERIVLTGFSMGGYGVYRTFYETPKRFHALAIFSGDPSIARRSLSEQAPDFLDDSKLTAFRNVPMFIFHGGRDRNCPIEQTQQMVEKLKAAGALVEFHYEADKGHESPSPATWQAFRDWVERVTSPGNGTQETTSAK